MNSPTAFEPPLTAREHQVADAIARGLSNREIAREFGISAETVKRHLASISGGSRFEVGWRSRFMCCDRAPLGEFEELKPNAS